MLAITTLAFLSFQTKLATFQCVLFKTGKEANSVTKHLAASYRARHLKLIESLWADNKIAVSGSFSGDPVYRGVAVFRSNSPEEVLSLLKSDPYVRYGLRELEIIPWMAEDVFKQPKSYSDTVPMLFGILERPDNAPDYEKAKLDQMQAGHLANIKKMASDGLLVSAGPFAVPGKKRGLFFFVNQDRRVVMDACAKDPAIQARRLSLKIIDWRVAKGALERYPLK